MGIEPISRGTAAQRTANSKGPGLSSRVPVLLAALVVVGVIGLGFLARPKAPPPEDLAASLSDIAPFERFESVGAMGWVAIPGAGMATDLAALTLVCEKLEARLKPTIGQTITILDHQGAGLLVCGDDPQR